MPDKSVPDKRGVLETATSDKQGEPAKTVTDKKGVPYSKKKLSPDDIEGKYDTTLIKSVFNCITHSVFCT